MLNRIRYRVPSQFNPVEYLLIHDDVKSANINPFLHYARHGRKESRPYRLRDLVPIDFDPDAYLMLNPDIASSGLLPELHYYKFGIKEGRHYKFASSNLNESEFDQAWYIEEYPEIINFGIEPFEHFKKYGRYEGRHPRFDNGWYQREYNDFITSSSLDPLEHYKQIGREEFFHPAFDPIWYQSQYSDVSESGVDPEFHYNECGRREGRHPAFHRKWYNHEYKQLLHGGIDPFKHYMEAGIVLGCHPAFNHDWYRNNYPDVRLTGLLPYSHYVKYGRAIGYSPAVIHTDISYTARIHQFPQAYSSEYQAKGNFTSKLTDIKAIAFYLPQFHEIAENNRWWGEGFTEWSNTRSAKPLFDGHYQPRVPHSDIGYYNLSEKAAIQKQAKLASEHGIHAFCFYYYWFSGKRLLEKPLDVFLSDKSIDIKFCLCWANENWTRTWDGSDNQILIEQKYDDKDPLNFIKDIEHYLTDARYIRIDGSPIVLVYKPHIIPNVGDVFAEWRRYWAAKYGVPLQIWCIRTNPSDHGFDMLDARIDAIVEFPPHVVPYSRTLPKYTLSRRLADINADGNYYDYNKLVNDIVAGNDYSKSPTKRFYRSVMLGWDNTARRKSGQSIWYGFSLLDYYRWLKSVVAYTRKNLPHDQRYIFINAWNEWAEGTYLEPDRATGYAAINTTSKAIFDLPFTEMPTVLSRASEASFVNSLKTAVHVHIFHLDLIPEIFPHLTCLPISCDILITTDTSDKSSYIESYIEKKLSKRNFKIFQSENIGRDVGPMLLTLRNHLRQYDLIGHFHTKKSPTVEWGQYWRQFLFQNLLGDNESIEKIMGIFSADSKLGLVKSTTFPLIAPHVNWGDVFDRCSELLEELDLPIMLPNSPSFPVGNMFWARTAAIEPILSRNWTISDFETEQDQVGQTLAHCFERLWDSVALAGGYSVKEVTRGSKSYNIKTDRQSCSLCLFVHYNVSGGLDPADLELIRNLYLQNMDIIVVSNSDLTYDSIRQISVYAKDVFVRPNVGFDFSAWRDAIKRVGWAQVEQYNEVIFANNSCYGPVYNISEMFYSMRSRSVDFWGITSFPRIENSLRPEASTLEKQTIPQHIQSYFMVFNRKAVATRQFFRFWDELEDMPDFLSVVASLEVQLTEILQKAGLTWDVYIRAAEHMQYARKDELRYNATYNNPMDMVLLGSPLVKKKAWDYNFIEMDLTCDLVGRIGSYPQHLMLQKKVY